MTITIFALIMGISMMVAALISVRNAQQPKKELVGQYPYQNWK